MKTILLLQIFSEICNFDGVAKEFLFRKKTARSYFDPAELAQLILNDD